MTDAFSGDRKPAIASHVIVSSFNFSYLYYPWTYVQTEIMTILENDKVENYFHDHFYC